ncbi:hypothetical protein LCGC14_1425430 [marine sediment metagenome]|uniref:Uncharacterized protein n=1 Tax=marine sediment metagenome TaxID=412755 RepID=A0A0F9MRW7_9ZZZZ
MNSAEEAKKKLKELKKTFNVNQERTYDALRWIHLGGLGTGRTYLLAIIFIEKAIENQNEPIKYSDHVSCGHDALKFDICRLLEEIGILETFQFSHLHRTITFIVENETEAQKEIKALLETLNALIEKYIL